MNKDVYVIKEIYYLPTAIVFTLLGASLDISLTGPFNLIKLLKQF